MSARIEIDPDLLAEVIDVSQIASGKAAVEAALRSFIENKRRRRALDDLCGMGWEGDLDEMRRAWPPGELI